MLAAIINIILDAVDLEIKYISFSLGNLHKIQRVSYLWVCIKIYLITAQLQVRFIRYVRTIEDFLLPKFNMLLKIVDD